jgi:hypothetical protein
MQVLLVVVSHPQLDSERDQSWLFADPSDRCLCSTFRYNRGVGLSRPSA